MNQKQNSNSKNFIHLNLHTEYSIQNSMVKIDDAIAKAKAYNMPALAITDLNNGFAWIKFYQAALEAGIKPILGVDLHTAEGNITLFAQNTNGYLNLCQLLAKFWQLQQNHLPLNELSIEPCQDLIAIIYHPHVDIDFWQQRFNHRLYIGLAIVEERDIAHAQTLLEFAAEQQLPIVATQPIYFLEPDDFQAHEVRFCISNAYVLNDSKRPKPFCKNHHFKSPEAMQALFKALPAAIENTWEIAQRCNLELKLNQAQLPLFPTPNQIPLEDFLRQESRAGLIERLNLLKNDVDSYINSQSEKIYQERLEFELNIIIQMGFAGYFLIVADFINWAKNNGVPVGPGRGSGAGSLVAYVLKITDLDPIRYGLLFERFLNPERVSMPDFDIDFCQLGRDRVIQYVKQKYGAQAVSQIATFGTMAAKAAIRDVGRVLQLGYNFVDSVAKLIPFKPGKLVTIESSLQEEPILKQRQSQEEDVALLLNYAQKMEGLTRNVGMHAGGVLIAPGRLVDFCPLYSQDGSVLISQYDKDDVEAIGLVKFDFLGLTTLSILEKAQKLVQDFFEKDFYYHKLPLKDFKTFELLKKGLTVAVFQLESRGMQSMLKDAMPDCFEDIIALVSLYRPGPMDLIPSYIARKHGREKIIYPDARLENVLKETYGIMVYQEQVMQIAQITGNYSLGAADLLRRAMGKKKPEEMAKQRAVFRAGAFENGLSAEKADEIFDLMEKFAGYGFNKSHAAAYALLAYYTAWFKAHYPSAFMAANLSLAMDDTDKVSALIQDCKNQNLTILPPCVLFSDVGFMPSRDANQLNNINNINNFNNINKDNEKQELSLEPEAYQKNIRYGLAAIKGLGEAAAAKIIEIRKEANYKDVFDFFKRLYPHLNKRSFEGLIKAGALDGLLAKSKNTISTSSTNIYNRQTILQNLERLSLWAQQMQDTAQVSLFDIFDAPTPDNNNQSHSNSNLNPNSNSPPIDLETHPENPIQALLEEKSVLGFFLSKHLIQAYDDVLKPIEHKLIALEKIKPQKDFKFYTCAIITQIRPQMTARGKMLIIKLENQHEEIEAVLYQDQYDQYKNLCEIDACVVVRVDCRFDQFMQTKRLQIFEIMSLEAFYQQSLKSMSIKIDQDVSWVQIESFLSKYFDLKTPTNLNNINNLNNKIDKLDKLDKFNAYIIYHQHHEKFSAKLKLVNIHQFNLDFFKACQQNQNINQFLNLTLNLEFN